MSTSAASLPGAAGATGHGDRDRSWWLVGGVAAELSDRLAVPVGFIRTLLILGTLAQRELLYVYVIAALAVPHAGRRTPSWSNLVAVGRIALLYLLIANMVAAGGVLVNDTGNLFTRGPATWLPFGGATLFGIVAVLVSGRPYGGRDARSDRAVGLATLLALVGLGLVLLAVALVPSAQWQFALGALAAIGGVGLAIGGQRTAGALVPVALLAVCAVLAASAGVRLQGGVGNATIAPVSSSALHPAYRRGVGDLSLYLTALPPQHAPLRVKATVGVGDLHIFVAPGAQVTGVLRVGRGAVQLSTCATHTPGPRYGFDTVTMLSIRAQRPLCGEALSSPTLRIRIDAVVGIGVIYVAEPGNGSVD